VVVLDSYPGALHGCFPSSLRFLLLEACLLALPLVFQMLNFDLAKYGRQGGVELLSLAVAKPFSATVG
jgi:hypothetical protein